MTEAAAPSASADSGAPAPATAAKGGIAAKLKKKAAKKTAKPKKPNFLFASEAITIDIVDEAVEKAKLKRVMRIVQMQIFVILLMAGFFIAGAPFFQTVYFYYAVDTSRHANRLFALSMPNMTSQAVLSWATNSITEIMTFGFGDYVPHLIAQRDRFTPEGWLAFVGAFDKMKMGQLFKDRQLVLTTVPSDTAVIVSQGPNLQTHVYEWRVQMPVVMTYATNDNKNHRDSGIITLTIARIPTSDNPGGIAIKTWVIRGG